MGTPLEPKTTSSPVLFSYTISEKLTNTNFLLWKQQAEPVIKAHRLHRYVVNPQIPPQFLTPSDCHTTTENPDFSLWETQDQLLLSWLQSSLFVPFLTRVIGCTHVFNFGRRFTLNSTPKPEPKFHNSTPSYAPRRKGTNPSMSFSFASKLSLMLSPPLGILFLNMNNWIFLLKVFQLNMNPSSHSSTAN